MPRSGYLLDSRQTLNIRLMSKSELEYWQLTYVLLFGWNI